MADEDLHSPRILCLHGGGVTAEIFRLQARAIIAKLSPTFRLVFADGPFLCGPGPGILPFFADFTPFRRWLRWLPEHEEVDDETAVEEIWYQLKLAMDEDDARGANGEWAGLLGFSQGAKTSACLLFDQQLREEAFAKGDTEALMSPKTTWKFGVLLAGRAPLVSLSKYSAGRTGLARPGSISDGAVMPATGATQEEAAQHTLTIPTIHVHGLLDPAIDMHRRLLKHYCDPDTTTLIEWQGEHRVPIQQADVARVTQAVFDAARRTGVIE